MDTLIFVLIIVSVVIGIIIASIFFNKKAIVKRKLKNANTKRISDFKNGEVAKIVGTVEFVDPPLIAPLSGRECAFYYVLIEQKVSSGKSSHWKTIIEKEISNKFVIRDENHCAFIKANGFKSFVVQDRQFSSGFRNDPTMKLKNYLKEHGFESEGFLGFNKTIRYKEGVLEKGEKVAVFGKGEWKLASALGLPDHHEKILVISSPDGESVYMSDDPETIIRTVQTKSNRIEINAGNRYLK